MLRGIIIVYQSVDRIVLCLHGAAYKEVIRNAQLNKWCQDVQFILIFVALNFTWSWLQLYIFTIISCENAQILSKNYSLLTINKEKKPITTLIYFI